MPSTIRPIMRTSPSSLPPPTASVKSWPPASEVIDAAPTQQPTISAVRSRPRKRIKVMLQREEWLQHGGILLDSTNLLQLLPFAPFPPPPPSPPQPCPPWSARASSWPSGRTLQRRRQPGKGTFCSERQVMLYAGRGAQTFCRWPFHSSSHARIHRHVHVCMQR